MHFSECFLAAAFNLHTAYDLFAEYTEKMEGWLASGEVTY